MSSCSTEKRITKFLNKYGDKDVATQITIRRPDLFKPDTVRIDSFIEKAVIVNVPEIIHDTAFVKDTSNSCSHFNYDDKNLSFKVSEKNGKTKVNYLIKKREIADTVKIHIYIEKPCPPCPQQEIINSVSEENKKLKEKLANSTGSRIWFFSFWILLALILIAVFARVLKR